MQRILILLSIVVALCVNPIFADAIISPDLQKAMEQERGDLPIILSMKKDLNTKNIRSNDKNQILETLFQQSEADQHFVNSLCQKLQSEGIVSNVIKFKLSNGMAMTASPEAIRELAMHNDIYSIILDAPQQMINPIPAEEARNTWGLNWIRASDNKGHKGSGVTVAVVDTGIQQNHPGFASGQILTSKGKSFVSSSPNDGNGHGTHCAGTIGSPEYGVATGCNMFAVKVLSDSGSGSWSGVQQGVDYAVQAQADVISMSLGGTETSSGNPVEGSVRNAVAAGVVVVIAAGNSGPSARTIGTPGCVAEVITVGAIQNGGGIASFSSRGATLKGHIKPDIVAPGVGVKSLWIGSGTNTISGTSMATPHVAGLAAVLLSANSGLGPQAVKNVLMQTAKGTAQDNVYGKGCIDVPNALNATLSLMEMGVNLRGDVSELRLEKKILVDIIDGQVKFEQNIYAPFEVTVSGMKANFACERALVTLGGKVIKDGPVTANQKETLSIKVGEGEHAVKGEAINTSVKSGKGEIIVYIDLW